MGKYGLLIDTAAVDTCQCHHDITLVSSPYYFEVLTSFLLLVNKFLIFV